MNPVILPPIRVLYVSRVLGQGIQIVKLTRWAGPVQWRGVGPGPARRAPCGGTRPGCSLQSGSSPSPSSRASWPANHRRGRPGTRGPWRRYPRCSRCGSPRCAWWCRATRPSSTRRPRRGGSQAPPRRPAGRWWRSRCAETRRRPRHPPAGCPAGSRTAVGVSLQTETRGPRQRHAPTAADVNSSSGVPGRIYKTANTEVVHQMCRSTSSVHLGFAKHSKFQTPKHTNFK